MGLDVDKLHRPKPSRLCVAELVYQAMNRFAKGETVMKKTGRILAYSLVVMAIVLLLFAWLRANNKVVETDGIAMLLDESATPAPFALSNLQEEPIFQTDDTGKQFATADDLEDRGDDTLTEKNLVIIEELEPAQ
jgi:hypothetical protein